MRFNIPFIYSVEAMPPKRKYAETFYLIGFEACDIVEYSLKQTNLIASAHIVNSPTPNSKIKPYQVDYLQTPQGLVKPFKIDLENKWVNTGTIQDKKNFQYFLNQWAYQASLTMDDDDVLRFSRLNLFKLDTIDFSLNSEIYWQEKEFPLSNRIVQSDRIRASEQFKKKIKNDFCIVDGTIQINTNSPAYRVLSSYYRVNNDFTQSVCIKIEEEFDHTQDDVFFANQEQAAKHQAQLLKTKNNIEHKIENIGNLEIFDPNWQPTVNLTSALTRTVDTQFRTEIGRNLRFMNVNIIKTFADLKELVEQTDPDYDQMYNLSQQLHQQVTEWNKGKIIGGRSNAWIMFENLVDRLEIMENNVDKDNLYVSEQDLSELDHLKNDPIDQDNNTGLKM